MVTNRMPASSTIANWTANTYARCPESVAPEPTVSVLLSDPRMAAVTNGPTKKPSLLIPAIVEIARARCPNGTTAVRYDCRASPPHRLREAQEHHTHTERQQ